MYTATTAECPLWFVHQTLSTHTRASAGVSDALMYRRVFLHIRGLREREGGGTREKSSRIDRKRVVYITKKEKIDLLLSKYYLHTTIHVRT